MATSETIDEVRSHWIFTSLNIVIGEELKFRDYIFVLFLQLHCGDYTLFMTLSLYQINNYVSLGKFNYIYHFKLILFCSIYF